MLKGERTACVRENTTDIVPLLSTRDGGYRSTNKGGIMDKLFIESRLSADGEALWPRVTGGLAGGAIAGVGGKFSYIKKDLGKLVHQKWAKTGGSGVG